MSLAVGDRPTRQPGPPRNEGRLSFGLSSGLVAFGTGGPAVGCAVTNEPWPAVIFGLIGLVGLIVVQVLGYKRSQDFGGYFERAVAATQPGSTVRLSIAADQISLSVGHPADELEPVLDGRSRSAPGIIIGASRSRTPGPDVGVAGAPDINRDAKPRQLHVDEATREVRGQTADA